MLTIKMSFLTCLAALIATGIVHAHPADGMEPRDLPHAYGTERYGYSSEFNINDLTFTCPYPDPTRLTDAERYILSGARSADGNMMMPWFIDIFQMVNAMYIEGGTVPAELKLGEMRFMARGYDSDVYTTAYDKFRSPITNEFPRLDATEFEPGQVYMRPLTGEEKAFFASKVDYLDDAWFKDRKYVDMLDKWVPAKLRGEAFYIRIYGERGVLLETIIYDLDMDDGGVKLTMAVDTEPTGEESELAYEPFEDSWDDWPQP